MSSKTPSVAAAPAAPQVLGALVKKMNCHAGVILNGLAVSGLHHKDHHCDMQVTVLGVHVVLHKLSHRPGATVLVPWANIYFCELFQRDEK